MKTGGVALVTGGGRGIGLGISRRLAAEGFDLAIVGRSPEQDRQEVLRELRLSGRRVRYYAGNLAEPSDRSDILKHVREEFGAVHVLVNNAGVAPRERLDLLEASEESFDRVIATNLKGPHFLTRSVAGMMVEEKKKDPGFWGCIVNITSVSAALVSTERADYCISKAGLSMATRAWAARLAEFDLPVYEVRPGIIRTDMTEPVREKYDELISGGLVPQARWGTPEDVGRVVASLARRDFPYSTGAVLTVDGGLTIRGL